MSDLIYTDKIGTFNNDDFSNENHPTTINVKLVCERLYYKKHWTNIDLNDVINNAFIYLIEEITDDSTYKDLEQYLIKTTKAQNRNKYPSKHKKKSNVDMDLLADPKQDIFKERENGMYNQFRAYLDETSPIETDIWDLMMIGDISDIQIAKTIYRRYGKGGKTIRSQQNFIYRLKRNIWTKFRSFKISV